MSETSYSRASSYSLRAAATVIAVNGTQFSISHGVPSGSCTTASGLTSEDLIYAELHYTCQPASFSVTAAAEVPGLLVGDSATMHALGVSIPELTGPRLPTHWRGDHRQGPAAVVWADASQ